MAETLYDKLWASHLITQDDAGNGLLYINRHLLHEVTSPQAFAGLHQAKRNLWRKAANLAVPDHNVPTLNRAQGITDPVNKRQVDTLMDNCERHDIDVFSMEDKRQGIVHVIGPEQGATLPGMTIVCGDSHTSTHGALGALAFGIGTSEVEHVLATQCLWQRKMKNMRIEINGTLGPGVTSKDVILAVIGQIGIGGGSGYAIEFTGEVIQALSIEARMTICNMTIEAGARAGMIAVDQKTIDYIKGRPMAPIGALWDQAVKAWSDLHSDADAHFDKIVTLNADDIVPQITWGTSPEMVAPVTGHVPDPAQEHDPVKRESIKKALAYKGLEPGMALTDIYLDKIFIGSCTNSRIEDLRLSARMVKGHKVASNIKLAMVVPGSGLVKAQAEAEGLDKIFIDAGFEWRDAGCSMCLAMNDDRLSPKERCASTSNRNFEGRQGQGGRTHLVSPMMAAAAAIAGHFVDIREIYKEE